MGFGDITSGLGVLDFIEVSPGQSIASFYYCGAQSFRTECESRHIRINESGRGLEENDCVVYLFGSKTKKVGSSVKAVIALIKSNKYKKQFILVDHGSSGVRHSLSSVKWGLEIFRILITVEEIQGVILFTQCKEKLVAADIWRLAALGSNDTNSGFCARMKYYLKVGYQIVMGDWSYSVIEIRDESAC